jgi:hypothetical protein
MEAIMSRAKELIREIETSELTDAELNEVSAGIIAVLQQRAPLCDGSVKPVAPVEKALIGLP